MLGFNLPLFDFVKSRHFAGRNITLITLLLTIMLTITLETNAQSARQVLATSGNSDSNSRIKVSWTMGEAVIQTVSNTNNTLTQGFQQPDGDCRFDDTKAPMITLSLIHI